MKLRHPVLIKIVAFFGAWIIRLWMRTLRYRYWPLGINVDPRLEPKQRYLYAFWHENMLLPAYCYGRPDIYILISQHADGELIAEICRHLRFRLIRGSTTRGGAKAVRHMLEAGKDAHLAITPDGPRGPRRTVQPGLIYVASKTGLPIIAAGMAYRKAWRLNSWDRFAVPKPWTTAAVVTLDPIPIPPDLTGEQLEHYRRQVEQAMHHASELAERYASGDIEPCRLAA
ncbi:MAG: hypothetical protein KatS3mg105_3909 [Gemmatales bacterium]|nr:MAG: hypothetical protein KatS3mg105_3909 [Gemmatales bacterium]